MVMPPLTNDIREALIADKRTLTSIAESAGIPRNKLSLFKSGQKELAVDSLERLAAALGLLIVVKKAGKKRLDRA